METRKMRAGSGSLDVTVLGFGGAPLGNLYVEIGDSIADATIGAAWRGGVRVFDTAPFYGLGISEERFGRVLPEHPRDSYVLSTKIGRVLRDCRAEEVPNTVFARAAQRTFDFDYSYDGVMRSHADSLKRLNQDRIDILLVHDIDEPTHGSREASNRRIRELFDRGGFRALEELRTAGVVKAIGAGVNEVPVCETLLEMGDFDCLLLASRYTLLEQEALDRVLPLCEKRDVGMILGGPFNSGILATGPIEGARYNYAPAPPEILDRVRRIERVCRAHGVRLVEAALQFVLGHPVVKTVIPGANSPDQVAANLKLLDTPVPAGLWSDLKSEKLLRPDAPVPSDKMNV